MGEFENNSPIIRGNSMIKINCLIEDYLINDIIDRLGLEYKEVNKKKLVKIVIRYAIEKLEDTITEVDLEKIYERYS